MFAEITLLALMQMTPELLEQVGMSLFGDNWQRNLARALAPHRKDGGNAATLDDSLVRKWKRGERTIPEWVGPALQTLLRERFETITALKAQFDFAFGARAS